MTFSVFSIFLLYFPASNKKLFLSKNFLLNSLQNVDTFILLTLYGRLYNCSTNSIYLCAYFFAVPWQKLTNKNILPYIFIVFIVTKISKAYSFRTKLLRHSIDRCCQKATSGRKGLNSSHYFVGCDAMDWCKRHNFQIRSF